jgi:DNA adenine methylase
MIMKGSGVVNVASVAHYSPFRYPGGKTWFVPHFERWLKSLPQRPAVLIEPFAGGAIVGLTSLIEGWVERLVLVEKDEAVASVWRTVFGERCEWLIDRILAFEMTRENVVAELSVTPRSTHRRAFQTILRNRVQRGGIMAAGASLMLNGEKGKGVASRWYPDTLAKRLRLLKSVRDRVTFKHDDAARVIARHADRDDAAFFIDPPYTAGGKRAGSRLYNVSALDHADLFRQVASARGAALLTYDDADEVRRLATRWAFVVQAIPMKNTHHAVMSELVIAKPAEPRTRREVLADRLREQALERDRGQALLFA